MSSIALLLVLPVFGADTVADLRKSFDRPPDDARIMMRWWWFGSAVTKPELEREMRAMKAGGIGGFEVQPVYPVALDDPEHGFRNLPYLSDEFLDALSFAGQKAKELGLRMDVTLGSGWPFGGPHTPITESAGRLRVERVEVRAGECSVALPDVGAGEKLLAAFLDSALVADLPSQGRLRIPCTGPRVVTFFVASRTGMQVKRPAVGADGYVLDHYDRAAIEHHLQFAGDRLLKALGPNRPYAIFSDSLEVYQSDWTADLLSEFQKRRGYELTPYLPALVGDFGPETAAIRHDWGRTLTELVDERYLTPLNDWARKNGTRFRSQTYGTPPVALSSNALVDLPEGEGFHWRGFSTSRWAASASHLYGKPVTSSETWTWLHSPAFRATPLDMKAEADLHFLQGINQLVGHGWPYSPEMAGRPGWAFYAAAVFNDHNPWWIVMPDITRYLQRVSFLLRQGKPANDVALYLPTDDAWAQFTSGKTTLNGTLAGIIGPTVIPQILDAGYNFDFIDDRAIERAGIQYPIVILPGVERIPLATLRKLQEYAAKRGIVVATRRTPSLAPGRMEQGESAQVRELARGLRLVQDEKTLGANLTKLLTPDLTTSPKTPEIGFIHRKLVDGDIYFIVNTSNHPVRCDAAFRIADMNGEFWDPFTAQVTSRTAAIELAPYESRVVVFSKSPALTSRTKQSAAGIDISGGWEVSFPELKRNVSMARLRSWDQDEETKYFSGQAIYSKTVTIPESLLKSDVYLDFGEGVPTDDRRTANGMRALLDSPVREAAIVYVNDRLAGSVWRPPYEVDVTKLLHAGETRIRLVVANLGINELAGKSLPNYRLLNLRYTERFTPQDMNNVTAQPAGVLGPIRLVSH